jgi:transcriptional regulator with XRE-family HTH domain
MTQGKGEHKRGENEDAPHSVHSVTQGRGERLRVARENAEHTLRSVEDELRRQGLELSFSQVRRYENDDTIRIKPSTLEALAKLYHTTSDFLRTGKKTGRESFSPMPTRYIVTDKNGRPQILLVPHKAEAGYRQHLNDEQYLGALETISLPGFTSGDYRAFEVSGVSMTPTFEPGDLVICEHIERPEDIQDGEVYVLVTSEGICLKRVTNAVSTRGYLIIESDNPAYKPDFIMANEVLEMWKYRKKVTV